MSPQSSPRRSAAFSTGRTSVQRYRPGHRRSQHVGKIATIRTLASHGSQRVKCSESSASRQSCGDAEATTGGGERRWAKATVWSGATRRLSGLLSPGAPSPQPASAACTAWRLGNRAPPHLVADRPPCTVPVTCPARRRSAARCCDLHTDNSLAEPRMGWLWLLKMHAVPTSCSPHTLLRLVHLP